MKALKNEIQCCFIFVEVETCLQPKVEIHVTTKYGELQIFFADCQVNFIYAV